MTVMGRGVVALLLALAPRDAVAACEAPPGEIVWSYPADGAVDVPTDAHFFLTALGYVLEVELDGQPLVVHEGPEQSHVGYEMGGLDPQQAYELTVIFEDGSGQRVETIGFETGAGPHDGPAPRVELQGLGVASGWDDFSALCQKVINSQDCYDEGQDTHVLLNIEGDAVAYLVNRRHDAQSSSFMRPVVWPALCGQPSVFFFEDTSACYTVYAFDEAGNTASSEELCGRALPNENGTGGSPQDDVPPMPGDDSPSDDEMAEELNSSGSSKSGCAISHPPAKSVWFVSFLVPFALIRRRSGREPRPA